MKSPSNNTENLPISALGDKLRPQVYALGFFEVKPSPLFWLIAARYSRQRAARPSVS
jgi:hypothetical protein